MLNCPWFIGSISASLLLGALLAFLPLPAALQWGFVVVIAALFWGTFASLSAVYWIYDRSPLTKLAWVSDCYPAGIGELANIHCGLDETSLPLMELFPEGVLTSVDIYDARTMTEPAIARARKAAGQLPHPALRCAPGALSFADNQLDAAFSILSAHEIRSRKQREEFFQEAHRVLKPGGSLLLVEHTRDLANFIVFGPGFLHFLSRQEWLRLAKLAQFTKEREFRITPFVRIFLLRKS